MKDSIYFSHDADARNDEKIIGLIMEHGYEGYGIFWAVVEMLRTATDFKMQLDCKRIAFALHAASDVVESVINDFELFVIDDNSFWSESLNRRMEKKKMVSESRRKAAQKRWDSASAMQMHNKSNANKMQLQCNKVKKVSKESKVNKEINNTPKPPKGDSDFDKFWDAYPRGKKKAKQNALKAWKKMKPNIEVVLESLEAQKNSLDWKKENGKYIPHPASWINGGCWDDEVVETNSTAGFEIV